jgi:hypothetical protein
VPARGVAVTIATMAEQLLNRIADLQRRLRRWRLTALALALLLISVIAVGGTMALLIRALPDQRELKVREDDERARRMRERINAEQESRQPVQAKRELERVKQRAQEGEGK